MTDPHITDLTSELKRVQALPSDTDWNGGDASDLWQHAKAIQDKINRGELYEPKF